MPYDSSLDVAPVATSLLPRANAIRLDDDFHRTERLVVIGGASLFGVIVGSVAAIALGQPQWWQMAVAGVPIYVLALYYSVATFHDAFERRAWGCASATVAHIGALFAWPAVGLLHPEMTVAFWIAPALAFSALVLFASCWGGSKRVLYRACAQGGLVAACAGFLGLLTVMGN